MLNLMRITKGERQRMIDSGIIIEEKAPDLPVLVAKTVMPLPDDRTAEAIHDVANATREMVEGMGMMSAAQISATQSVMERISEALVKLSETRSWKRIKLQVTRDRNDNIKEADIQRVE